MDFKLTEEQLMLQQTAREFVQKEVKPVARELDARTNPIDCFSWELLKKASQVGFRTAVVPLEYGGGGLDLLSQVILTEELAAADAGFGYVMCHAMHLSRVLFTTCNEEQKKEFLPKFMADDNYLLAYGLTEPSGWTDKALPYDAPGAAMDTFAEKKGDEYIINGTKVFISNGAVAKLYIINARTNKELGITKSWSQFLVPREAPGFSIGKVHNKLGMRFSPNAELILEDVHVPAKYLIGKEGNGYEQSMVTAAPGVITSKNACLVGAMRLCYEEALEYAKTRIGGGKPIIEHHAIEMILADMEGKIKAGRLLLWQCAWNVDNQNESDPKLAWLTKAFLDEIAVTVTTGALEIFGGYGTDKDMPIEKCIRDVYNQLHGFGLRHFSLIKGSPNSK